MLQPPTKQFEIMSRQKALRSSLVADLGIIDGEETAAAEQAEYDLLFGKYFAAPSPNNRAKCQDCREVIMKGTLRVGNHDVKRIYSPGGSYSRQLRTSYEHGSCFLSKNGAPGVATTDTQADELSESAEKTMGQIILDANDYAKLDHDKAAINMSVEYPGNMITFGN